MITEENVMAAFMELAPEMMGGDPEAVLKARDVDPAGVAGVGNQLAKMYALQQVNPEEAVPATFAIGFLIGMKVHESASI